MTTLELLNSTISKTSIRISIFKDSDNSTFYFAKNIDKTEIINNGKYRCHCKVNESFCNYKYFLENL